MKEVNNYILLVDYYKSPRLKHNTAGRYRVGAKTPGEAVKLLREKIGFGSIQVYYKCSKDDKLTVPYKTVVKEVFDDTTGVTFRHEKPLHANAPHKKRM
ncbi:MAG: hypothetical protein UGF89_08745 [Acutalibacteraceae bacterium]|nr:hypothetical protein [Acutalibacteraceae bacterium]